MSRVGLTFTMVFLAESANYGEGVSNISALKKMSRGNYEQYTYISRQAIRYNIIQQLNWNNTPVALVGKGKDVVQFAPSATIKEYPEIDLFGYMKTTSKKDGNDKGKASTRSAVVRLSNAVALEPYQSDLEFLTNMGLAKRQNLENGIAQSEIHRSFYTYTITIDLDKIGIDGEICISQEEKARRVKDLLDTIQFLYRDIKGRRENLAPVFVIGGRYVRKNPFFENRILLNKGKVQIDTLTEIIESSSDIKDNTFVGVASGIFENDVELKQVLHTKAIAEVFNHLKKEVDEYYGESN